MFAAITLWSGLLVAGMALMASRDSRPGHIGSAPREWPAGTTLACPAGKWSLLVFAHPHCPCTRATLRELEKIVARCEHRLAVHVLFCVPERAPSGFERGDLWRQAESIPGVRVSADLRGVEAQCFGAQTSGDVLLFDEERRLRFHGGITGSRGHEGENRGCSAVLDLIHESQPGRFDAPVFGCSLFDDEGSAVCSAPVPTESSP